MTDLELQALVQLQMLEIRSPDGCSRERGSWSTCHLRHLATLLVEAG